MKLTGNNMFETQLSKFFVFRKRNGKSIPYIDSKYGVGEFCWNSSALKAKRLHAFVKGIQVFGAGISMGIANTSNEFSINVDTFDYDNLSFDLQRVSSNGLITVGMNHEMTEIENNVKINYEVDQPGRYFLNIKYLGISVPNSPFKIDIRQNDLNAKGVIAIGKGLRQCLAGDLATFRLDTRKSANSEISVIVDGDVDIPLSIKESRAGYKIQYLAKVPGVFFLRIKCDGKHITGSPFLINAETNKRELTETIKSFFKRNLQAESKEKKNDLQP